MEKLVVCKSCGITLKVPQRNGEPFRDIRCPNCSHKQRVDFGDSLPNDDDGGRTIYSGGVHSEEKPSSGEEGSTKLSESNTARCGFLRCDGQIYALRHGRNVIGRGSSTSDANVQIKTDDLLMSRKHSIINMTRLADGSLKALISNFMNKHATYVGGLEMKDGDEIILTDGISLKMGDTTLEYYEE